LELDKFAKAGFDRGPLFFDGDERRRIGAQFGNAMITLAKTAALAAALGLWAGLARAQDASPPAALPPGATNVPGRPVEWPKPQPELKPIESSISALTNAPLRMVEPGIFEIGKVRLNQRHRSITLPATLNRAQGPMEYFLVTSYGKTHESILKTQAEPFHIHLAMLLLGAEEPGNANFPGSPANGVPGPVVHPSKEILPGNKVAIEVKWKTPDGDTKRSAEDLIYRSDARAVMGQGSWVYNGSLIIRNRFLAQMDGSIISLVTDPVALINNIGPGHDNDMIWTPNTNNLPPPNIPVEVTITLEDTKPK
jgi:hypothetical protein